MYFTGEMRDKLETAEQSPSVRFAREFLPKVNAALSELYHKSGSQAPTAEAGSNAAPVAADEATPAEPAASDAATTEPTDSAAGTDVVDAPPATLAPIADQGRDQLELTEPESAPPKSAQ